MTEKESYTPEEAKKLEDEVQKVLDDKPPEWLATAYWYMHANDMTLEKAKSIRRKKKLTGV